MPYFFFLDQDAEAKLCFLETVQVLVCPPRHAFVFRSAVKHLELLNILPSLRNAFMTLTDHTLRSARVFLCFIFVCLCFNMIYFLHVNRRIIKYVVFSNVEAFISIAIIQKLKRTALSLKEFIRFHHAAKLNVFQFSPATRQLSIVPSYLLLLQLN